MNFRLEFFNEASAELTDATRFYESRLPGLGMRFRSEVEQLCAAVVSQPLLWRERPGGFRRANIPGFPYYLAYFVRGECIVVAAVGHARRHPDYWKRRKF